ncbi:MAG: efflux transporter outer membrane subunit [Burkholderiaceae bacterium]
MRALRFALALATSATLAACALTAPPAAPELAPQARPNLTTPSTWSTPGTASGAVGDRWLAAFNDRALDALVVEALAYNADLRVAAARVDQAAAYVTLAGGTLYPQVMLLARGGGKMSGDSSGLQGMGLIASWELDLWGRVRAGRAAAQSQYASAALDTEYARQSMAALTAKSWFLATEALQQKALAESMLRSAERLLALTRDRVRVGQSSDYDLALAQANALTYRDAVAQLELARQQALRAIEVLVGRYPAANLAVPAQLPELSASVPAGMPSELLERRPDVIAAERRVAAAFYSTEQAKAARLPQISLSANLTSISSDLFVLQNRDNPMASAGASLLAPIFLGGQLQSQVEIKTAEQKLAIADYGRISTRAFAEVESALAAGVAADSRETILVQAVNHRQRALEHSLSRYRVGSNDLRAVTQDELGLYSARSARLRVQAERLVQRVNLHLALGGNFDASTALDTTAPATP